MREQALQTLLADIHHIQQRIDDDCATLKREAAADPTVYAADLHKINRERIVILGGALDNLLAVLGHYCERVVPKEAACGRTPCDP